MTELGWLTSSMAYQAGGYMPLPSRPQDHDIEFRLKWAKGKPGHEDGENFIDYDLRLKRKKLLGLIPQSSATNLVLRLYTQPEINQPKKITYGFEIFNRNKPEKILFAETEEFSTDRRVPRTPRGIAKSIVKTSIFTR